MTTPTLLYLDGATEGTTQWRAETLQMINWGGFQGHHQVSLAVPATLLSGASGTGKSTLLDAYLALMMPSDTPFNGASNDATIGRVRGADQRSLLSYLKGKTDDRSDADGVLTEQVLRGENSATWGAVAVTFIDDRRRRFTALRIYFVPRGTTVVADTTMKLATKDGFLDLSELGSISETKFDKRALKTRFPELTVFETYAAFATTLHTRLGIGANGDGGKALRLLARIQAGHHVNTVDGLYKSLVLEEPATYAAADKAIEHFVDLKKSYDAMVTEDQKSKVLERIPDLYRDYDTANKNAETIDTFGVHRDGDTPFTLWRLRTERELLDQAAELNRTLQRAAQKDFVTSRDEENSLNKRIAEVQQQQRENGGDALAVIKIDLETLGAKRAETERARTGFDYRTEPLSVHIQCEPDFTEAQTTAEHFLKTFNEQTSKLENGRDTLQREQQYPLQERKRALTDEFKSLSGRDGLVTGKLHEARLMIAEAAGVSVEDLPFVAELLDIAPGQEQWRKAAEVTLFSVARIMLVNETTLNHLSRTIDPLRIPGRINFEGVALRAHQNVRGDQDRISGKVIFKDSPFSGWVQDRVQAQHTDALCVENPFDLGGGGPRVSLNGQTRNGKRGAHGDLNSRNIIGFSNKARLAQISVELTDLTGQLDTLTAKISGVGAQISALRLRKEAHQFMLDTQWLVIDVDGVDVAIAAKEAEQARILANSDILRALNDEEQRLGPLVETARKVKFKAEGDRDDLDEDYGNLVDRQDTTTDHLDRIATDQSVSLSEADAALLDAEFAAEGSDLAGFNAAIDRLLKRLVGQSRQAREDARKASEALSRAFQTFQDRWPDPNLGTALESYTGYRDILDTILTTGLHGRKQEWKRRLSEWSGQDLVPLNGAFETSIDEIEDRLTPVNEILSTLPFGAGRDRLKIVLRRLHSDDVTKLRRELKYLSSGATQDETDEQTEARFGRLSEFMALIRKSESGSKALSVRDRLLDVRRHVEITAVRMDLEGIEQSRYSSLGGKSGGETQELVAFIVGAALRFQLGDESRTRPRFAPVFLDEGFVKADSEFAGRAVAAWKGLGFQIIIGAPLDKVTALEPYMDVMLTMTKNPKTGYSYITPLVDVDGALL